MINSQSSGVANLFTWLDAYDSVTHSTTLTQGFAAPTKSLNPYAASSVFDFQTIGNVYDSLGSLNPAQSGEYFDYLTSGHSTPCNTNLSISCDLAHLGYTPPSGTIGTLRFSLRPDIFWQSDTSGAHPARPLTSWDVKFTYFTLPSCPFQGGLCFSSIIDIHVLDKANFDINLNTIGPFTLIGPFGVPSLTIVPGRYWSSTCSGATWDNDVNAGSVPTSCMAVTSQMSTITFDPLSSTPNNGVSPGILIGSGPFECQSSSGVVGTGCSSTGTQNPPPGGSYTLTRFGCNRATGTCNAPGANPTSMAARNRQPRHRHDSKRQSGQRGHQVLPRWKLGLTIQLATRHTSCMLSFHVQSAGWDTECTTSTSRGYEHPQSVQYRPCKRIRLLIQAIIVKDES